MRPYHQALGAVILRTNFRGVRRMAAAAMVAGAVLAAGAFAVPAQAATVAVPTIVAKGGYVMNNGTGQSLYTKSANTRRSTGSTTKVMTARVVLGSKKFSLEHKVTIQQAYSDYIGSK